MSYLELDELEFGESYLCHFYDGSEPAVLTYIEGGSFENEKRELFSVHGDIRYVLENKKCGNQETDTTKVVNTTGTVGTPTYISNAVRTRREHSLQMVVRDLTQHDPAYSEFLVLSGLPQEGQPVPSVPAEGVLQLRRNGQVRKMPSRMARFFRKVKCFLGMHKYLAWFKAFHENDGTLNYQVNRCRHCLKQQKVYS